MTFPVAGAADVSRPRSVLDLVGNTPLSGCVASSALTAASSCTPKRNGRTPAARSRTARRCHDARRRAHAACSVPGRTILDATSGNTGIAYAMIGAARGYPVKLCMPENVTPERKRILRAYGAELVLTDPMEGSDGAIREVRADLRGRIRTATTTRTSTATRPTGRRTTTRPVPRSWRRPTARVTHFVAGLGTSGTFVGTGRFLREHAPHVQLVSVQPDTALHGLEGMKHMESAIVPGIYDATLADVDMRGRHRRVVSYSPGASPLEEGLLVGISSGAALAAGLRVADCSRPAVDRHDLQRRRREIPLRAVLGRAARRLVCRAG